MESAISKKETMISYTVAIAFILAMVGVAVYFNDSEIILPEIAAMAVALWAYREPGWIRQPSKIFVAPSITAVIGFAVNQLDIAYLAKVILTLCLMMLFLRLIQSNLAPALATGLLPLVTNAHEWSFIISIFVTTIILMLGVLVFQLNKGLEKKVKIHYKYMVVYLVLSFLWIGVTWVTGFPQFAVIPPIAVVIYEVLQKPMYNGKMALKQVIALTLSATVGTVMYFVIDSWVLATLIDMLLMLVLLRIIGIKLPAVFAFPLLPFVFPEDVVSMIPVGSLAASIFLFGGVLLYKKWERKQAAKVSASNL